MRASGSNNVVLTLDCQGRDYEIDAAQKYLIVKGSNLSRTSGTSYLWWLNGVNKGSQVAPTSTKKATDGDIIVTWDMTRSGLADNNIGDRFSICQGPTIFGLTSTTGTSVIRHIGFYKSVADFENATAITPIAAAPSHHAIYGLDGRRRTRLQRGPQIVDGRTVVKQ